MTAETRRLDDIAVGERDRTDLGDIATLADSICTVGLLHPVVIVADGTLVAGDRRLAAVRSLGWSEVTVTVVDLDTAEAVLRAEADENTCREGLTPYEASRARKRRARVLAPIAKAERGKRTDLEPSSNLDEGSAAARATRKAGAAGTGYSGSTLDKVDRIADVAERGVVRVGKAEVPVPVEVQQQAIESLDRLEQHQAPVDREDKALTRALDTYLDGHPDVSRARLRANVHKAAVKAGRLADFDVADVADAVDDDFMETLARVLRRIDDWADAVRKARPRGLRIIGGSE